MKEHINIFHRLLDRFKFRDLIPVPDQKFILFSLKNTLVITLKSLKEYSFIYGIVLRIFFRARRMGIRLTVSQSIIVLGILSSLAAAAVAAGIFFALKFHKPQSADIFRQNDGYEATEAGKREAVPADLKDKTGAMEKDDKIPIAKFRIGIEQFGNENIGNDKSRQITVRIGKSIKAFLGNDGVINLDAGKKEKNINIILTGSVGKLGDLILISAKLIDVEKGRSLLVTGENIRSESEINGACDRISGKIIENIKNIRR